jgi:hypothetical protein
MLRCDRQGRPGTSPRASEDAANYGAVLPVQSGSERVWVAAVSRYVLGPRRRPGLPPGSSRLVGPRRRGARLDRQSLRVLEAQVREQLHVVGLEDELVDVVASPGGTGGGLVDVVCKVEQTLREMASDEGRG